MLLLYGGTIMIVLKLKKWGNSHGLILPKSILRKAHIDSENVAFEVSVNNKNEIILKSKKEEPKSLKELFQNFDYKKYWSDYEKENPGKSKEMDWGKSVGREVF